MSGVEVAGPAGGARPAVVGVLLALLLTGCGAASDPGPAPSPSATSTETPSAPPGSPEPSTSAAVPTDGVTLSALGFRYAPPGFSVPRTALFATTADQPNAVTLVISAPPPAEVADYLRRALPAAGFVVTDEAADGPTLTFAAPGWSGSFTATSGRSAILLRPA